MRARTPPRVAAALALALAAALALASPSPPTPPLSRAGSPPPLPPRAAPLTVVTFSDRAAVSGATGPALAAYCARHGFALRALRGGDGGAGSRVQARLARDGRAAAWAKLLLLADAIDEAVEDGGAREAAGAHGEELADARAAAGATAAGGTRRERLVAWLDDDILLTDARVSLALLADRFGLAPPGPLDAARLPDDWALLRRAEAGARTEGAAAEDVEPLLLMGAEEYNVLSRTTGAVLLFPVNTGVIVARADARAAALLRLVYDAAALLVPRALQRAQYEQDALALLWPSLRHLVRVAPWRALQSQHGHWREGDFALHPAGLEMDARVRMLRERAAAAAVEGVGVMGDGAVAGGRGAVQPRYETALKLLASLACVGCGRAVLVRGARAGDAALLVELVRALRPRTLLLEEVGAGLDVARLRADAEEEIALAARAAGAAFFALRHPREVFAIDMREGGGDGGEVALALALNGTKARELLARVRWSGAACKVGGARWEEGVPVGESEDGAQCVGWE